MELYSSADANVILAILCHKIIKAQAEEGLAEARMLLQDWWVFLSSHCKHSLCNFQNSCSGRAHTGDDAFAGLVCLLVVFLSSHCKHFLCNFQNSC